MASEVLKKNEQIFLERVMEKANLPDIYDARNLTNIVFRSMRDLMTNSLDKDVQSAFSDVNLENLWEDDNPFVSFLSHLRSPLEIDSETFLRRIEQEGGLPKKTRADAVVIAVFSTAREALPKEEIERIGDRLPEALKIMWEQI